MADLMIRILGDTANPYIMMTVFFMIPFLLTQVMSNLATLTIFIPLVTSACLKIGVDPRAAVVGVLTASCISILTPMAAPCQIMIIEPGGYTFKDYLKNTVIIIYGFAVSPRTRIIRSATRSPAPVTLIASERDNTPANRKIVG